MGAQEGNAEGDGDGALIWDRDGKVDGSEVTGREVGELVGHSFCEADGNWLDDIDGTSVGGASGDLEGASVGRSDGCAVGFFVGVADTGSFIGDTDGVVDGISVT